LIQPNLLSMVDATVGQDRYKIGVLDATKAYPLYCKLLGKLGAVFEAGGAMPTGADLSLRLIGKVMQSLDPELVGALIAAFGPTSQIVHPDGSAQTVTSVFATHFAGRMGHMMGWLTECVKVNFADFLPPILQEIGGLNLGAMLSPSMSPKTSPGSSPG
jgi:hypothetical protein